MATCLFKDPKPGESNRPPTAFITDVRKSNYKDNALFCFYKGDFADLSVLSAEMRGPQSAGGWLIDATGSWGPTVTRVESDWLISSRTCWYFIGTWPAVLPGYRESACACAWAGLALLRLTNFLLQVKLWGQLHWPSQRWCRRYNLAADIYLCLLRYRSKGRIVSVDVHKKRDISVDLTCV